MIEKKYIKNDREREETNRIFYVLSIFWLCIGTRAVMKKATGKKKRNPSLHDYILKKKSSPYNLQGGSLNFCNPTGHMLGFCVILPTILHLPSTFFPHIKKQLLLPYFLGGSTLVAIQALINIPINEAPLRFVAAHANKRERERGG